MNEKELEEFIKLELESNLHVLIDPKKKDSFSDRRINTWRELVSERIVYHLNNKIKINKL
tara:strand:- start:15 stop:194 length:180 start_codon:yes stop_codon:yes gene_type:complete